MRTERRLSQVGWRSGGRRCLVLIVLLFAALPDLALANDLAGQVVAIADGDTLTLLSQAKQQVRVRLAEIDTPERGQPYSNEARKSLARLVFGKKVSVEVIAIDRYGRSVGRVKVDGLDVSAELVREGAAWVYRKYSTTPQLYELEAAARDERRGLWGLPEAQREAPWEWRRRTRPSKTP